MIDQSYPRGIQGMPTPLIIAALVAAVIIAIAIRAMIAAPKLGLGMRLIAAAMFIPIALFASYGYMAAMEPGDFHLIWRVLYATVAIICVASIGRMLWIYRS